MDLLDAVDEVSWYREQHSGSILQVLYGACQVAVSLAVHNEYKPLSYALLGLGLANVGLAVPRLFEDPYLFPDESQSFSPIELMLVKEMAGKEQYAQL